MTTTTSDVYEALHARYPAGKYVNIQEAPERNASGRRCDFVAIGVWGSTKNEIIGHEVKVSRADWQKELQDPSKSEAFSVYCDRWYIVAPPGIVKLEEVRASWGLMELAGNSLKIRRQAEKRVGEPLDRNMMASWMRRVSEGASKVQLDKRYREGHAAGKKDAEWETKHKSAAAHVEQDYAELRGKVMEFEQASGLSIRHGWNLEKIGRIVHALSQVPDAKAICKHELERMETAAGRIRSAVKEYDESKMQSAAG